MNIHEWLRTETQKHVVGEHIKDSPLYYKQYLSLPSIYGIYFPQNILSFARLASVLYENLGTTERKCSKGYHSCWHYFPPSNILFKSYLPSRTFRKGDADQTRGLRMTHCLSTTTPKGWRTCSDKYYPSSWRSTAFPLLRYTRVHLELSHFYLRLKSVWRMLQNKAILLIFNRFIHVEKSE